ncbi:MAG: 30S ribosomal protein S17 [Chloroflexota bacterium]
MRKIRVGSVVRTRTDKTAVVETVWKQRHRLYQKQMRRVARYYVHDSLNQCQLGDVVRIQETRPISKSKRWRLLEILERRQVAEVRPIELESDVEDVLAGASAVLQEASDLEAEPVTDQESLVDDDALLNGVGSQEEGLTADGEDLDQVAAPIDGPEPEGEEDREA